MSLLLASGAEVDFADAEGWTPLMTASEQARLLDAGADPNAQNETENLTAISWAAEHGNADVVTLLLERGVDPNVDDRTLFSALYGSKRGDISGSHAVMEMLVKRGVNIFMDCWTDERPLVIAAEQGRCLSVELFLEASYSSASVRQEHIWDAITVGAEHGEGAVLASLMRDYDPDETEKQTPWEWVKEYRFGHSYELLRPYFEPDARSHNGSNESD
ncbi:Ankyrin repeat [Fusarium oxysporum f. sp. vasinfectum]|nr:Ankyrin repeat [Fusarium oxysporum f. sp. vasinfectum]KAK2939725.1 Ankyrin repeat [Fusarium oxysporum f. sp. vasinfectum]